jgi:hypothetical protein
MKIKLGEKFCIDLLFGKFSHRRNNSSNSWHIRLLGLRQSGIRLPAKLALINEDLSFLKNQLNSL